MHANDKSLLSFRLKINVFPAYLITTYAWVLPSDPIFTIQQKRPIFTIQQKDQSFIPNQPLKNIWQNFAASDAYFRPEDSEVINW